MTGEMSSRNTRYLQYSYWFSALRTAVEEIVPLLSVVVSSTSHAVTADSGVNSELCG